MAQGEVTGQDESGLWELQHEYEQSPKYLNEDVPFEVSYCLTEIGKQPEEYDGYPRYCTKRVKRLEDGGHAPSCRFHGGNHGGDRTEYIKHLEKLANLKHGMYSTDEHLKEVFTEKDQELYDWVMSWADTYGWPDREEDPSRYDDLEAIAVNRVRIARSHKYILDEGEMKREEIYDENGNLREVDNAHALSEDTRLKRKLITDMKKELGITPKERSRQSTEEKKASAAEQVADLATEAVLGGGDGYDPDDEVFDEE